MNENLNTYFIHQAISFAKMKLNKILLWLLQCIIIIILIMLSFSTISNNGVAFLLSVICYACSSSARYFSLCFNPISYQGVCLMDLFESVGYHSVVVIDHLLSFHLARCPTHFYFWFHPGNYMLLLFFT